MAGNKKPRHARKPRRALLSPMVFGISEEDTRNLKLVPHLEFDRLRAGAAEEESWHTITCRLNWGLVMAGMHDYGIDVVPIMRAGLDAMVAIRDRREAAGKYGGTSDELNAVHEGLNYCDALQDATTRREHRDALRVVLKEGTL